MKTVVKNDELARLWVAQSQPNARSSSGSLQGTKLSSYSTVIAAIVKAKDGTPVYLLNSSSYSGTTSTLQGLARAAVPAGAVVFEVPGVDRYHCGEFTDRKRIATALAFQHLGLLEEAGKSREPKKSRLVREADDITELAKKVAAFVLLLALGLTGSAHAQEPTAKAHAFLDRTNLALFSADALVRSLDAQSTRKVLTDPCHCYHEDQLPPFIVQSTPKMVAYSFTVAAAIEGAAYLAHRTHHHRIERIIPLLDIVGDGRAATGNYMLQPPKK